MREAREITGLSYYLIRFSIKYNKVVRRFEISREDDVRTRLPKKNQPQEYMAINNFGSVICDSLNALSRYTNVNKQTINECILDGTCVNGWCFDLAMERGLYEPR